MATVNRTSLREAFDEQKRTFERLKHEGRMTPESIALVNALLMLMEMLVAVFLEKTTSKTGLNSGLPSSRSAQDETARSTSGARGKGPKEKEAACANTRTVTVCEQSVVEQCRKCGEDLTDTASCGHERRTLVDIVFETVEHHVDAQIKRCPRCRAENRGRFPDTMPGSSREVNFAIHSCPSPSNGSRPPPTACARFRPRATERARHPGKVANSFFCALWIALEPMGQNSQSLEFHQPWHGRR